MSAPLRGSLGANREVKCWGEGRVVICCGVGLGLEMEDKIRRGRRWGLEGGFGCEEKGKVDRKRWFWVGDGCGKVRTVVNAAFAAVAAIVLVR